MSVTSDDEFSFLWVEFQFDTVHAVMDTSKSLSELRKTGIKVPMLKCQVNFGVIGTVTLKLEIMLLNRVV